MYLKNWGSIFPKLNIKRDISKWENHLLDLTPIVFLEKMWFKREDMFAPLGYGGINGSKLRQAIWLVSEQNKLNTNSTCLISGASIKSPQLPMSSAVAYHFGYKSLHVIGATKPETSINADMVKMATWFGAKFSLIKVGFNPALQNKVNLIMKENTSTYFKMNYGITVASNAPTKNIVEFHDLGANQVRNIPEEIENIIIPAGSCNSLISILFGITKHKPANLKNIYIIGIGPNKMKFVNARLQAIKKETKINTLNFIKNSFIPELIATPEHNAYKIKYIDIHNIPKYDYQNEVKFTYKEIEFHPTYEGKVMDYVTTNLQELISPKTLMWIVGSKPRIENMVGCEALGSIPRQVMVYSNDWEKITFKKKENTQPSLISLLNGK